MINYFKIGKINYVYNMKKDQYLGACQKSADLIGGGWVQILIRLHKSCDIYIYIYYIIIYFY